MWLIIPVGPFTRTFLKATGRTSRLLPGSRGLAHVVEFQMRRFVTIAVAAVLVATCGSAPCPCHLIALLRPVQKQNTRLPLPARPACKCCLAHYSDASDGLTTECSAQADRLPDPPKQPCEHGQKVELGSTGVPGEPHVEVEADHVEVMLIDPHSGSHVDLWASALQFLMCPRPLPHLRALRFVHAFRS